MASLCGGRPRGDVPWTEFHFKGSFNGTIRVTMIRVSIRTLKVRVYHSLGHILRCQVSVFGGLGLGVEG